MADQSSAPRRYTPPNQRIRSGNRRRSGDRLDRASISPGNGGERGQSSASRNVSAVTDHGEPVTANFQNQRSSQKTIISLEGCSQSEAYKLHGRRWAAAMHLYNDPTVDLSERPIMYYGGNAWGKLPHKILASANTTGPPSPNLTDYQSELRRALPGNHTSSSNN